MKKIPSPPENGLRRMSAADLFKTKRAQTERVPVLPIGGLRRPAPPMMMSGQAN